MRPVQHMVRGKMIQKEKYQLPTADTQAADVRPEAQHKEKRNTIDSSLGRDNSFVDAGKEEAIEMISLCPCWQITEKDECYH